MLKGLEQTELTRMMSSTRFVVFLFVGVCITSIVTILVAAQIALQAVIGQLTPNPIEAAIITNMFHVILVMGVVTTFSVLGLAVTVLIRLVQPLRDLNWASNEIGQGNLKVRVPKRFDDEFGRTAEAFNLMADKMETAVGELKEANTKLLRVDKAKNSFVNAVSHELRTPLTSVVGYTEFLEEELGGPLSPDQKQFVGRIKLSVNTIVRMVDDLLDFARLEAGTFKLREECSDLKSRVCESIGTMTPYAETRHIKLVVDVPDNPVMLRMDHTRIGQVINNFIGNAVKFSLDGGVVHVNLFINPENKTAFVNVQDDGPGLTLEEQDTLFKMFSQTESGKKAGGTGLGLAISKQIVEAHKGRIGVVSNIGSGSTFWFELPMQVGVDLHPVS